MGLKLMCVVAHPDDECFAFGGAIALAAEKGAEVHVICLTDGQAATNRGQSSSNEELGRIRRAEFAASCRVLGVSRHEFLDYQDAQLEFADFHRAAGLLVERIRSFRPQVLLTFGHDGALNTHPDHTMVSSFTSAAFHWAGSEKRYPELGPVHQAERLYVLSANYFLPDKPAPLPIPWTVCLDVRSVKARKEEAFRQHASQAPLMERTKELFEEFGDSEVYTLVAAVGHQPAKRLTDLFEGIRAE